MKVLAVGASLSTLSMAYALRTAGFSVSIAERLSQMNFNKKLNVMAPQNWGHTVSSKPQSAPQNFYTNPSHYRSSQHLHKHSLANISTLKTLSSLRLDSDNNILKLPLRGIARGGSPSRRTPAVNSLGLYERNGHLGLGVALEFIPTIHGILEEGNTAYDTKLDITSVSKEQLTYRFYHQLRHLDTQCFAFSKKFMQANSLGHNQGMEVHFEDGSREVYDLLICGDAMADYFRSSLQQTETPCSRQAVSAILKKNIMRRPHDGIGEFYCGKNQSFVVQRLNDQLYKWTVSWEGEQDWIDPSTGDYPEQLKQQALKIASQLSYGRDIVADTSANVLFQDDSHIGHYEPRTEASTVTHPLIATGDTAFGLNGNNPYVDVRTHLAVKNAKLFQDFVQRPHTDFYKEVILKYEKYMAHHQEEIQKSPTFLEMYLHQSSFLDRIGMRLFQWGWKQNVQMYRNNEQGTRNR